MGYELVFFKLVGIASSGEWVQRGFIDIIGFFIPNYVDTKYYKGTPTDKWQYKFLWYGGELEYKFAISSKLDFATIFVPGYPDLMAFAVGLNL